MSEPWGRKKLLYLEYWLKSTLSYFLPQVKRDDSLVFLFISE